MDHLPSFTLAHDEAVVFVFWNVAGSVSCSSLAGLVSKESLHEGCTIAYARPLRGSAWDGINEATSLSNPEHFIFDRTPPTHRQPTETVTGTEVIAPLLEAQPAPLQVAVDAFGRLDHVGNNGALTMLLASNLSGGLICFSWRA
jgi:hypothetical protein